MPPTAFIAIKNPAGPLPAEILETALIYFVISTAGRNSGCVMGLDD